MAPCWTETPPHTYQIRACVGAHWELGSASGIFRLLCTRIHFMWCEPVQPDVLESNSCSARMDCHAFDGRLLSGMPDCGQTANAPLTHSLRASSRALASVHFPRAWLLVPTASRPPICAHGWLPEHCAQPSDGTRLSMTVGVTTFPCCFGLGLPLLSVDLLQFVIRRMCDPVGSLHPSPRSIAPPPDRAFVSRLQKYRATCPREVECAGLCQLAVPARHFAEAQI